MVLSNLLLMVEIVDAWDSFVVWGHRRKCFKYLGEIKRLVTLLYHPIALVKPPPFCMHHSKILEMSRWSSGYDFRLTY